MSRNKPKYALHKATGQSRVRLAGKDHYLGTYDSPESRLKYEELVGRHLSNQDLDSSSFRCDRLALQYLTHARDYYRKNGKQTSEVHAIRVALRHLVIVHGNTLCLRFGPKALVEVRDSMVAAGIVRSSVNRNIGRIRRAFKWAVSQEFLPVDICRGYDRDGNVSIDPERRELHVQHWAQQAAEAAGLGDQFAAITKSVGIQPCNSCTGRQVKLNKAFPKQHWLTRVTAKITRTARIKRPESLALPSPSFEPWQINTTDVTPSKLATTDATPFPVVNWDETPP